MRKVAHPSSYLENVASAHRTKSKKTRRSNCLQMSLQRQHFLLSYFTDPKCWSCQDLIQGPPAYTVGLTGRQLNVYKLFILCRVTYKKKVSSVNTEILESRNHRLTDLNCSEACRSTRMTSNLADRLVSPGNEKNMKKAVLIQGEYDGVLIILLNKTYMQDTQASC